MTTPSFLIALGLATSLAWVLGWVLQRRSVDSSLAANWALGLSCAIAIPALLSDSLAGMARMVWPREAIDWLPMALVGLLIALSISLRWKRWKRWKRFSIAVGTVLCIVLAFRFLYGSVYLRPGQFPWQNVTAIGLWGTSLAAAWLATATVSVQEKPRSWIDVVVSLVLIGSVAGTIGMSGSFTYGAIGLVVAMSLLGQLDLYRQGAAPCIGFGVISFGAWDFLRRTIDGFGGIPGSCSPRG